MKEEGWLYEIKPKRRLFSLELGEVWRYRDLLMLFVRRDIVASYKQTILGPLWFIIQPLFTSVIFTLLFNNLAEITTGTAPPFLFNLAGITLWTYFKQALQNSSRALAGNASLFAKVYFPRVIVPLSKLISSLFKTGIQFIIFIVFYIYYVTKGFEISPTVALWLFPLLIIFIAALGMGMGMVFSGISTKYRDFSIFLTFGIQLFMYASAVMYPLSEIRNKPRMADYAWVVEYNPVARLIESFRYMSMGEGLFSYSAFFICGGISIAIFFIGIVVFNQTERSFIDTV